MKLLVACSLFITSSVSYPAEVSCNLDGLVVDGKALPFGESTVLIAHGPAPAGWDRLTAIRDGISFDVDEIDGKKANLPIEILAFGALPKDLPETHRFRLEGHFGDAYSFGAEISASFKVTQVDDLGNFEPAHIAHALRGLVDRILHGPFHALA